MWYAHDDLEIKLLMILKVLSRIIYTNLWGGQQMCFGIEKMSEFREIA